MPRGRAMGKVIGPYVKHSQAPTMHTVQRVNAGLTQESLAIRAGVSVRTVRNWEALVRLSPYAAAAIMRAVYARTLELAAQPVASETGKPRPPAKTGKSASPTDYTKPAARPRARR